MPFRIARVFPTLLSLLAVAAGPPGEWTRITDLTGRNIDEVAAARTGDGVLHVAWVRRSDKGWDLVHSAIDSSGRPVGAATAIVTGWSSIDNPFLVTTPEGGLRVLLSGVRGQAPGDPYDGAIYTATSGAAGDSWTLAPSAVSQSKNTAAPGATLTRDGQVVTAWAAGMQPAWHLGVSGGADQQFGGGEGRGGGGCCVYLPALATDAATGEVVLAWYSNIDRAHGLYARTLQSAAPSPPPPAGAAQYVPGSANATRTSSVAAMQRVPLVARSGAPGGGGGVYVAFCAGYPVCRTVSLWRHGSGRAALTVAAAAAARDAKLVNAAAAPEGRLWVMWSAGNRVHATRSNRAATRFGPVVSAVPIPGAASLWKLQGDAALGPLDLLAAASTSTGGGVATWHTRLLPALSLSARPSRITASDSAVTVVLQVTDAGDPVAGATVALASQSGTTDSSGRFTVILPPGTKPTVFPGRATLEGYVGAGATVVVVAKNR